MSCHKTACFDQCGFADKREFFNGITHFWLTLLQIQRNFSQTSVKFPYPIRGLEYFLEADEIRAFVTPLAMLVVGRTATLCRVCADAIAFSVQLTLTT